MNSVAFFPDGRRIVSGSSDTSINVWDPMARTQPRLTLTDTIVDGTSAHGSEAVWHAS